MPRPLIALAIAVLMSAPAAGAQEVRIDHRSGVWTYRLASDATRADTLKGSETIRLNLRDSLRVRVVNTNSALYTCTLEQAEAKVPELEAFRGAVGTFGPYLVNIAGLGIANPFKIAWITASPQISGVAPSAAPAGTSDAAEEARHQAEASLAAVDGYLFGADGLHATRLSVLETLNAMRTAEGERIDTLAAGLTSLKCPAGCDAQTLASRAVELLNRAGTAQRNLQPYLDSLRFTNAEELNQSLMKLQADAEALTAAAFRTEQLVRIVADAKPEVPCGLVRVRRESGRALAIVVAPRGMAETDRVAMLPPRRLKAEAQPRLFPRPAVGVALLFAPRATYEVPGTRSKVGGGGVDIVSTSTQDSRFTYGLTVSMVLTDRVGPVQLPFTLGPELVANPSSDTRAIGLGVGGTILGGLKWGTGALWTRHKVLRGGQEFEDVLPAADHLRTRDTFGKARLYVSASLTGWPLIKL